VPTDWTDQEIKEQTNAIMVKRITKMVNGGISATTAVILAFEDELPTSTYCVIESLHTSLDRCAATDARSSAIKRLSVTLGRPCALGAHRGNTDTPIVLFRRLKRSVPTVEEITTLPTVAARSSNKSEALSQLRRNWA